MSVPLSLEIVPTRAKRWISGATSSPGPTNAKIGQGDRPTRVRIEAGTADVPTESVPAALVHPGSSRSEQDPAREVAHR